MYLLNLLPVLCIATGRPAAGGLNNILKDILIYLEIAGLIQPRREKKEDSTWRARSVVISIILNILNILF